MNNKNQLDLWINNNLIKNIKYWKILVILRIWLKKRDKIRDKINIKLKSKKVDS